MNTIITIKLIVFQCTSGSTIEGWLLNQVGNAIALEVEFNSLDPSCPFARFDQAPCFTEGAKHFPIYKNTV